LLNFAWKFLLPMSLLNLVVAAVWHFTAVWDFPGAGVARWLLGGVMIAVYYVHLFIAGQLVGYLGGLLGTMPDTSFWLLHVGLMAVSVVGLIAARVFFGHLLAPAYASPSTA